MQIKARRIGFVGTGRMGANMARRLALDCGYTVAAVYDVNRSAAQELADELGESTRTAARLAEVTEACDIVFTVVTNDAAMEAIYFGGEDHLLAGGAGRVFVNCATVSPAIHLRVAEAAAQAGARVLELPMASSIPQARQGTLFLMAAGSKETFAEMRPLLEDLSAAVHYIGGPGTAAQVKALVNMVMNIHTAALAEGLGLAQALGLDLEKVKTIFAQTGANSRVLETDADDMIARDHDCYFSAEHAAKDSGIATDLATVAGLHLPLAVATRQQFQRMVDRGLGHLDKSGIAELTFPGRGTPTDAR